MDCLGGARAVGERQQAKLQEKEPQLSHARGKKLEGARQRAGFRQAVPFAWPKPTGKRGPKKNRTAKKGTVRAAFRPRPPWIDQSILSAFVHLSGVRLAAASPGFSVGRNNSLKKIPPFVRSGGTS